MNSTLFLHMFGLDPDDFDDAIAGPEETEAGWAMSVRQAAGRRECPACHKSDSVVIKDRYVRRLRHVMPDGSPGTILVERPKLLCRRCSKCFFPPLKGLAPKARMTSTEEASLKADLMSMLTFAEAARRHGISEAAAIRAFDRMFPEVPGRPLPATLCIDEVLFVDRVEGRYPAVLYDWDRRELVDMVRSRQKAWLEEWFSKKPRWQLENVRFFVSDMYDEYARVRRRFLPNAIHVIDLFHVVKLLSDAVKRLRANAMNAAERGSLEYSFMKSRWRLFQIRESRIPGKYYEHRATGEVLSCREAVLRCVKSSRALWDAWDILQELYRWNRNEDFASALAFVERIAGRLESSGSPLLSKVGATYRRWRVEIANGFARTQTGRRFSNGVAEGLNNRIKTLKKISNGCLSFDRFRRRVLLILTYSKPETKKGKGTA